MRVRIGLFLALGAGLAASSLSALTYVHVSDQALADQAEVIARVEVVESRITVTAGKQIYSDYTMFVEDVVKGFVDGAYLTVRVPGGYSEELGLVLDYPGTPRYSDGSRGLLFLRSNPGETFRILHLVLGDFREAVVNETPFFVRDVPEPTDTTTNAKVARDADRFVSWLRDRSAGETREPDYFVSVPKPIVAADPLLPFTLRGPGFVAWEEFQESPPTRVTYKRHKAGQKGVPKKGKKILNQAFKALNNIESAAATSAAVAGAASAGPGLTDLKVKGTFGTSNIPLSPGACAFENVIIFNDERGFIGDPFSCTQGGILAVGGSCRFTQSTRQWKGEDVFGAVSGRVIFNENTACFYQAASNAVGEGASAADTAASRFGTVAIHEFGHTLGLKHSCGDDESPKCSASTKLNDATMRASVHSDGRGTEFRQDDLEGMWQLYDPDFFAAGCHLPPGHKNFCKRCGPCGEGQGKCKKNNQCFGDLSCKNDPALGYKTCQ